MKTDRTTINNPRHPEYYAEARDAIMDLCPFYDPNHKGGIVREAVFKSCLQELREREKVLKETMETLAMEWDDTGDRMMEKTTEAFHHRGTIFRECARRVREILGQNDIVVAPARSISDFRNDVNAGCHAPLVLLLFLIYQESRLVPFCANHP